MKLLLTRLKLFHARLQQECRCFAEWTSLGVVGCVGIGGCIAFGLSALATILRGHARIDATFLAGGIGLVLELGVLTELFLANNCDEKVRSYRRKIERLKEEASARQEAIQREKLNALLARVPKEKTPLPTIQDCLNGLGECAVLLLAVIGYLAFAAFFVLTIVSAASAPRDQQMKLMNDIHDSKQSHPNNTQSELPGPETMAVVGGIVLFLALVASVFIIAASR